MFDLGAAHGRLIREVTEIPESSAAASCTLLNQPTGHLVMFYMLFDLHVGDHAN